MANFIPEKHSDLESPNEVTDVQHLTAAEKASITNHAGLNLGALNSYGLALSPTLSTPYYVGQTFWDVDNQCPATVMSIDGGGNITSLYQHGQEMPMYWTNDDGTTHVNGTVTYIYGGTGKRSKVKRASAAAESTSYVIAVATVDVTAGNPGKYTTFGNVTDIPAANIICSTDNEADWTENKSVFLSTESGKMTVNRPVAPNHGAFIGTITERTGNGVGLKITLMVNPKSGYELGELHDIDTTKSKTTPVDADALLLQDSEDSSIWKKLSWANIKATLKSYFDDLYSILVTELKSPAGYVNRSESTLSYNSGTRTITLTVPTTTKVCVQGVEKTVTTDSVQHDNTVGIHYAYIDTTPNLVVPSPSTTAWNILAGDGLTATAYWNGTKGVVCDERHGIRDLALHKRLHGGEGAIYDSSYGGGAITAADGSSFSMNRCRFFDEDIPHDSGNDTHTTANVWWRNAVSPEVWTWDDVAAADYRKMNGAIIQYDNGGVLTDLPDGYYCNYYMWQTNIVGMPIIVTVGQNIFSTDADAMAGLPPALPIGQEAIVLHRFTYQRVGSVTNYIRRTDWRGISRFQIPPSVSVAVSQLSLNAFPSAIDTTLATIGAVTGVVGNLVVDDGTYLIVTESAGTNPAAIRFTLKIPVDGAVSSLMTNGRYAGSASHEVGIYLALQGSVSLSQAVTVGADNAYWGYVGNFNKNTTTDATQEFPLTDASHRNAGFLYVRYQHNNQVGIGTHQLLLDKVMVEYQSQGLLASRVAATPAGNLAGATVEAQLYELDAEKASTASLKYEITYSKNGVLSASTGNIRRYITEAGTIQSGSNVSIASVGTAPTGSAIALVLKKNGSSIATASISAGSNTATWSFTNTTLAAGDYLTMDVSSVGSTVAGSDLFSTIKVLKS